MISVRLIACTCVERTFNRQPLNKQNGGLNCSFRSKGNYISACHLPILLLLLLNVYCIEMHLNIVLASSEIVHIMDYPIINSKLCHKSDTENSAFSNYAFCSGLVKRKGKKKNTKKIEKGFSLLSSSYLSTSFLLTILSIVNPKVHEKSIPEETKQQSVNSYILITTMSTLSMPTFLESRD